MLHVRCCNCCMECPRALASNVICAISSKQPWPPESSRGPRKDPTGHDQYFSRDGRGRGMDPNFLLLIPSHLPRPNSLIPPSLSVSALWLFLLVTQNKLHERCGCESFLATGETQMKGVTGCHSKIFHNKPPPTKRRHEEKLPDSHASKHVASNGESDLWITTFRP